VSTDVSEEYIASIFRAEKIICARNQRESRWQTEYSASRKFEFIYNRKQKVRGRVELGSRWLVHRTE
jgi:hypothetical protein